VRIAVCVEKGHQVEVGAGLFVFELSGSLEASDVVAVPYAKAVTEIKYAIAAGVTVMFSLCPANGAIQCAAINQQFKI
jgi:hypothetical protein